MDAKKRQSGTPLKDRLFEEHYKFSFFKAVSLLESLSPVKSPLGQTLAPGQEAVRFSVKPSLAFPGSDISRLEQCADDGPAQMEVTFMGLIGPAGVMPHWYTELVYNRIWKKDHSLAGFLNIFHHRLISLFYLAWKKYRFEASYLPDARDRLSHCLLSLAGLGTPGLIERIGLPAESLAFYSGLLSRSIPSAQAIESAVEYFAGTEVNIEQFIERLLPISSEDQTRLGAANSQLGVDAVCGSYIRECTTKFRVNLGPVGYENFQRFLPTGDLLPPIFALVRCMVGIEFEFDITVFLNRDEVPPCILGEETPAAPRLGWSTWVKSPDVAQGEDPAITFEEQDSG
ncbi:MAG: type VI secretion system baseplate subunit TssG [bacterium]|nr:type VI secretion system baseplate subunit TssG [bacterium]